MKHIHLMVIGTILLSCDCDQKIQDNEELTLSELYAYAVSDARDNSDDVIVNVKNIKGEECCLFKNGKIKMVTWIPDNYKKGYAEGTKIVDNFDIWATIVPELKDICLQLNEDIYCKDAAALQIRLEQLLGLPMTKNNSHFVEFWVDTSLVYRPTLDPSIHKLVLDDKKSTTDFYKEWFENRMEESFNKGEGYPWTRLGYTYDWSKKNGIGLSEFVVIGKRDSSVTIQVDRVFSTGEYCGCLK